MKRVISSLLVAAVVLCANVAKADNVSLEQARSVAAYFMGYYTCNDKLTEDDLTLVYQIDNKELGIPASYFFNVNGSGWVILAGTTVMDPIIAHATIGSLVMDELPENMMWWLNGYSEMVSEYQIQDAKNHYPDHEVWTALSTKTYKGPTKYAQVVLMNEKWGQGNTNGNTYDMYCPVAKDGRHSVVGCVATAMSQIMHYYRYPKKPTGTPRYWLYNRLDSGEKQLMDNQLMTIDFDTMVPFNYSLMPDVPTTGGGSRLCTVEEMREVARLSYYAGVAVKMGYTPDGSGTQSAEVVTAMRNYFKYESSQQVYRNDNNGAEFVRRIRNLLLHKDVVYMSGASSIGTGADAAGHAWVCCGYIDGDTVRYYMNWGWNGGGDNFFNLATNNMYISSQGYNFNQRQAFIEGMVPPADSNRFYVGIVEADPTHLGSAYPNPAIQSVVLPYNTQNAGDLVVYNIEGKAVATYRVAAGAGEVTVNVEQMPAGIYIYRLNSQSGRFTVVK